MYIRLKNNNLTSLFISDYKYMFFNTNNKESQIYYSIVFYLMICLNAFQIYHAEFKAYIAFNKLPHGPVG